MINGNLAILGSIIRDARLDKQLTQMILSEETGLALKSIQNIEKGLVNPSYGTLYPLVNRLGIPGNILFDQNISEQEELQQQIIITFNSCSPDQQNSILSYMKFLENENKSSLKYKH